MKRFIMLMMVFLIGVSGCARFNAGEAVDTDFQTADQLVNNAKYDEAAAAYDKIAKESFGTERGAHALFLAAALPAYHDNPRKDYAKALQSFEEFLRIYPNSDKSRDAQNWRSLLKTILELKKENERLSKSIEELKRIDIRHEERRKGK